MKVLIVDDEKPARERLHSLIDELPGDYENCGEAGNGVEALQLAETQQPDIVLLDIRMPGMDGLEAARHLATMGKPPAIIFVTAYSDYALEAFEVHAVGYLLKPIRKERLQQALTNAGLLNRAQLANLSDTQVQSTRTHLCARLGEKLELIPIGQVLYFQADQKYVTVRHLHGEVLIEEPLKSLETEFGPAFLRIHRNALVAVSRLAGLQKTAQGRFEVLLNGCDERLEVSRRHAAGVRRLLKSL
ncbi:MAG: LytTR family DNA-binding domain-containing protein [Candidatus Competibacteraceae bacterium]|jgi:two-component system response regulator AlgR|nr:LytTR family DNA-binding domain-containing protein [Candidatus Competibacteraceae bacterium]